MKKILITCFAFLITGLISQIAAFADEIIDTQGNIIKCKVETVEEDFVQYKKDGNLYTFTRENNSSIFDDYIDVRVHLNKEDSVTRISGKIIAKDMWGVIIKNDSGLIDIPFFRIKFVGVYKPS